MSDPRLRGNGFVIPSLNYCDQPYLVVTPSGAWVCVLTTGAGLEGEPGQHVAVTVSRDRGRTWSEPAALEPPDGPEASWATPYLTPYGRICVFYVYNGDRVTTLPGSGERVRSDTHGWYAWRYSDDDGATWSERLRIPMPAQAVDRRNPWRGEVVHFWGIDKPKEQDGAVAFAFTRLGKFFMEEGEGWLVRSPNLAQERDPARVEFRLLPASGVGIRDFNLDCIQEEFNLLPLGGDDWLCVCRTDRGVILSAYSRDGGASWSVPEPMRYRSGGRFLRNPRACPRLFDAGEGRFLLWFHHNGNRDWTGRNPVWMAGGRRGDDGTVHWSEPELILFDPDPDARISYPDLVADGGEFLVSETDKKEARLHRLDPALLAGMWNPPERGPEDAAAAESFGQSDAGWSLELVCGPAAPGSCLWMGGGLRVYAAAAGVAVEFGSLYLESDSAPEWRHLVIVADRSAGILSLIVDGRHCDGAGIRPCGWARLTAEGETRPGPPEAVHAAVASFRCFNRPLTTAEAVGCRREAFDKTAPG